MKYKSVILGCGPRAAHHAEGYQGLDELYLNALCDKNSERLNHFGQKYSISNLYTDFEEMLDKEKPDVLHVVAPPIIREEPIETAIHYGVKGIIIEKPIALTQAQINKIKAIVKGTNIKIATNMQRRYYPEIQKIKKIINDGLLGDLIFIRCPCKANILSWGPHLIDLFLYFLDDVPPHHVWACAYGMNGYDYGHPAPANMMVNLQFPGQITVYLEEAEDAVGVPGVPDEQFWEHCEIDFWGTKGRAWWKVLEWGYQCDGMEKAFCETFSTWEEMERIGQREFTRAMAHWLDDDKNTHLNCLDTTLKGFDIIMAAMKSAYIGKSVQLPVNVEDNIMEKLEEKIK